MNFLHFFFLFHVRIGINSSSCIGYCILKAWFLFSLSFQFGIAFQVKLHFTETALRLIAKKAISKNTGARGLRSLLESILMDAMYEVCCIIAAITKVSKVWNPVKCIMGLQLGEKVRYMLFSASWYELCKNRTQNLAIEIREFKAI